MQERKQQTNARNRKAEKKKTERETLGNRTEPETPKPRTRKTATRPRTESQKNTQPLGRNKNPKKTQKSLDVAMQDGVRVRERGCRQDTQGARKTPGPPGTAGVFIAPAPETKRRQEKGTQQTNSSPALLHKEKQVVATMPPTPRGRREKEEN